MDSDRPLSTFFLLIVVASFFSLRGEASCLSWFLKREIDPGLDLIRSNRYPIDRSLYEATHGYMGGGLGWEFELAINAANENTRILSQGAGLAKLEREILNNSKRAHGNYNQAPHITAVTYSLPLKLKKIHSVNRFGRFSKEDRRSPVQSIRNFEKQTQGRFKFLEGRLFEDIPNSELGRADIIIDQIGALSYGDVVQVLRKDFAILSPNGEKIYASITGNTQIKVGGKLLDLPHWLETIPGIKVTHTVSGGTIIERVPGIEVKIPDLKIIEFKRNSPPNRVYEAL